MVFFQSFVENVYLTTTFCNVAYRVLTLIKNTDQIYDITKKLDSPLFAPRNDEEEM